jgi:hypothetical protein
LRPFYQFERIKGALSKGSLHAEEAQRARSPYSWKAVGGAGMSATMIDVLAGPASLVCTGANHRQQPRPAGRHVPQHVSCATGASLVLEARAMAGPEARVADPVARLIATWSRGWERFVADHDDRAPRCVPRVPARVVAVLADVTTRTRPPTRVFCAWGRGCGTVTCLAAVRGDEAYGLELDAALGRRSRARAAPGDAGDNALHQFRARGLCGVRGG